MEIRHNAAGVTTVCEDDLKKGAREQVSYRNGYKTRIEVSWGWSPFYTGLLFLFKELLLSFFEIQILIWSGQF